MKKNKLALAKKSQEEIIRLVFDDEGIPMAPPEMGGPNCYIDLDSGDYLFIDTSGRVLRKSKAKVKDLCTASGFVPPEVFPGIRILYNPKSEPGFQLRKHELLFNSYQTSRFQSSKAAVKQGSFPTIDNLLKNIFVDQTVRDSFLNWLAVIFNECRKTGTAWVIVGPQGSGKNILYRTVLKPLLGESNCRLLGQDDLSTRFNQLLADQQLVCFNEVKAAPKAQNRLKTWITEDEIVIEDKNVSSIVKRNPVNLIFLSNNKIPVHLDQDDRRFSVVKTGPPLRNLKWFKGERTVNLIRSELSRFAWFLTHQKYDVEAARVPITTKWKEDLIEESKDEFQIFSERLRTNDHDWVLGNIQKSSYSKSELSDLSSFNGGLNKNLTAKVFKDVFRKPVTKTTLTQMFRRHDIQDSRGKSKNGTRQREYVWNIQKSDKSD